MSKATRVTNHSFALEILPQDELVAALHEKARRRKMTLRGRAPSEELLQRLSQQLKSGTATPVSRRSDGMSRRPTIGSKARAHHKEVAELALSPGLPPSLKRMNDVSRHMAISLCNTNPNSSTVASMRHSSTSLKVAEVILPRVPSKESLTKGRPALSPSASGVASGATTPAAKVYWQQSGAVSPEFSFIDEPDISEQRMVFHGREVDGSDFSYRDGEQQIFCFARSCRAYLSLIIKFYVGIRIIQLPQSGVPKC